eukprot:79816-Prymnesium_polylepis.4
MYGCRAPRLPAIGSRLGQALVKRYWKWEVSRGLRRKGEEKEKRGKADMERKRWPLYGNAPTKYRPARHSSRSAFRATNNTGGWHSAPPPL